MWRLSLPQLGVFMTVEALKCGKRGPREVWYIDILHPQGYTISGRERAENADTQLSFCTASERTRQSAVNHLERLHSTVCTCLHSPIFMHAPFVAKHFVCGAEYAHASGANKSAE